MAFADPVASKKCISLERSVVRRIENHTKLASVWFKNPFLHFDAIMFNPESLFNERLVEVKSKPGSYKSFVTGEYKGIYQIDKKKIDSLAASSVVQGADAWLALYFTGGREIALKCVARPDGWIVEREKREVWTPKTLNSKEKELTWQNLIDFNTAEII